MRQFRIEIKWSLIYAAFVLLWSLGEQLLGFRDKYLEKGENISMLIFLPVVVIYFLAILDKKKNFYNGKMLYTNGFLCGIWLTVGIMLLTPLVQFISSSLISPDYFKNLISYSVEKGIFSPDEAKKQFSYGNYVFVNIVIEMLTGVVFAAFAPIWLKSDKVRAKA